MAARIDSKSMMVDIMAKAKVHLDAKPVLRATKRANITSLGHAGAYIRGTARRSIGVSDEPSLPGKPPHSRKGKLKDAVLYSVERDVGVVIGPSRSVIGRIGHTHEFGGRERVSARKARKANFVLEVGGHGPITPYLRNDKLVIARLRTERQVERARAVARSLPASMKEIRAQGWRTYAKRPFMGPALDKAKDRLPRKWANSIK